jgi:hypothetical protein
MPKKPSPEEEEDFAPGYKARAAKAAAAAEKASKESRKREEEEAAAWADGADARGRKKAEKAAADAAEKEASKRLKEELLKKEEEELAAGKKLRGDAKVAAKRAAKAAEDSADVARTEAPSLVARSIDEAIAVLTVASGTPAAGAGGPDAAGADHHAADVERVSKLAAAAGSAGTLKDDDRNPEKRMKAAWMRWYERELPLTKAEYPSLKLSQHKEMLWRRWQKSPENPLNAAVATGKR